MASSKANRFDPHLYELSLWFKDLGHPARIIIVLHLLEYGTTSYDTLCKLIILDKVTVSQHLCYLREEGIISMQEISPHSYYSLNTETVVKYVLKSKDLIDKIIRLLRKSSDQDLSKYYTQF